ncbi:MAG: aldo/keto reductase [Bifidobacteriaceae bacterium]|nr:aldo/keto reductase [Bifidobacteriaceae bacterium]
MGTTRLVLGGAFGLESQADSDRRLEAFAAAGGQFVESGFTYFGGKGMAAVGAWQRGHPGRLKVVMKIGHGARGVDIPLTRENIFADATAAVAALHVPALGVMVLHCDDPGRPVDEIADTLVALIDQGVAEAVGVSNWTAPRLAALVPLLLERGHLPLASYHFSLAAPDAALFPGTTLPSTPQILAVVGEYGLPLLSWSANAGGFFARTDADPTPGGGPDPFDTPLSRARRARCRELAALRGLEPATVALAWSLGHPQVWASVGPDSPAQLEQALAATALDLSPADSRWLADGA